MENRRSRHAIGLSNKPAPLPKDYMKLVQDVFTDNFSAQLQEFKKDKHKPSFEIRGEIYPQEIVLCVSLVFKDRIKALTAYASCDFDPQASSPTLHDLLSVCVDALANVYTSLLDVSRTNWMELLLDGALSDLKDAPLTWSETKIDKHKLFIKVDASNPNLDEMTDEWLKKNDPDYQERLEKEEQETEELFITGPKDKKNFH